MLCFCFLFFFVCLLFGCYRLYFCIAATWRIQDEYIIGQHALYIHCGASEVTATWRFLYQRIINPADGAVRVAALSVRAELSVVYTWYSKYSLCYCTLYYNIYRHITHLRCRQIAFLLAAELSLSQIPGRPVFFLLLFTVMHKAANRYNKST